MSTNLTSEEPQQIEKDDVTLTEEASIDCIPDEILEYILSLTSAYCDFKSALRVSKRWYSVIKSMSPEFTIYCLPACAQLFNTLH